MDVLSYIPSISLWIRWQPNPPLRRASSFRKGLFYVRRLLHRDQHLNHSDSPAGAIRAPRSMASPQRFLASAACCLSVVLQYTQATKNVVVACRGMSVPMIL